MKWRKVNGRYSIEKAKVTALDALGSAQLIAETGYTPRASQSATIGDHLRHGASVVETAFLAIVQPDALHATTVDEFEAIPCYTELQDLARKTTASLAASAVLAAAVATCATFLVKDPLAPPVCATLPFLQGIAAVALVSMGLAASNVTDCFIRRAARNDSIRRADSIRADSIRRARDSMFYGYPVDPGNGGGSEGGGGGDGCNAIDWYISYDGGITWYFAYRTGGGPGCPI